MKCYAPRCVRCESRLSACTCPLRPAGASRPRRRCDGLVLALGLAAVALIVWGPMLWVLLQVVMVQP